jgi:phosphonate transport system substrate-binding protein
MSACSVPESEPSIDILRIGILPDEGEEALRERYVPLLEFLSQASGLPYKLVIPNNYAELVRQFGEGQIDLAYFGGVTFVNANSEYGAMPLVMRDVDSHFTSAFIVADEGFRNLKELQGKRFSFGSRLSTSGHLMPRHFLHAERGIAPEKYFGSIEYSGKHDLTAYRVRDGGVDAGVVNTEIIRKMFADGRLKPGDIRIIWTTPPYPDYVWAVHPRIHPVARERIQQAFLQLTAENPQEAAILSRMGTAGFYPVSTKDFSMLVQTINSLDKL